VRAFQRRPRAHRRRRQLRRGSTTAGDGWCSRTPTNPIINGHHPHVGPGERSPAATVT
jgi:hypothetical protein